MEVLLHRVSFGKIFCVLLKAELDVTFLTCSLEDLIAASLHEELLKMLQGTNQKWVSWPFWKEFSKITSMWEASDKHHALGLSCVLFPREKERDCSYGEEEDSWE